MSDVLPYTEQCEHCGRFTIIHTRTKYSYSMDDGDFGSGYKETVTWSIKQCAICDGITVIEDHDYDEDGVLWGESKIHYPVTKISPNNLPDAVMKAYEAALKVRHVEPNACAVLVGRTLEAACNHEKAQGKVLADKLNYLAKTGRIPNTLADMAQYLKELRNLGAHADEDEVTEEDVPIILDFVEAILEYLYIAPAKVEAVRARIKKTS